MTQKTYLPCFQLFFNNTKTLQELRPLYGSLIPKMVPNGYRYKNQNSNFEQLMKDGSLFKFSSQVTALNTSILMNTFSYFEGYLESIIVQGLKLNVQKKSEIEKYLFKEIVKASSLDKIFNFFYIIFEIEITKVSSVDEINMIKNFYFLRHILIHASIEGVDASKSKFTIKSLNKLCENLQRRYGIDTETTLHSFLLFNEVIDDFVCDTYNLCKKIEKNLLDLGKIHSEINPYLVIE